MTKTAELVLNLRPNQGWWITLYRNGYNDGVTHGLPFGSKGDATTRADRIARAYKKQGYETKIRTGENLR